jgi:hypothetical protein
LKVRRCHEQSPWKLSSDPEESHDGNALRVNNLVTFVGRK